MCAFEEKRKISRADYGVRGQAIYKGGIYKGEIKNFSLNGFLFSDTLMLLKKELGDIIHDENRVDDEFLNFLEG